MTHLNTRAPHKTHHDATRDSGPTARGARQAATRAGLPEQAHARPMTRDNEPAVPLSGAAPVPQPLRGNLAQRFGQSFEGVRLHRGAQAEQSAAALDARAYTVGEDIVLGAAAPPLDTHEGRKLLAHESAHVLQQRRGGPPPELDSAAAHEDGAARAANTFVNGAPSVDAGAGTGIGIARDEEDEKKKGKGSKRGKGGKGGGGKKPDVPPPGAIDTTNAGKASPGSPKKPRQPLPGVDPDIDADVEKSFVEESADQAAPTNKVPAKRRSTRATKDARDDFRKNRDTHAARLGVGDGGQVHHAKEIQLLKLYPGVFSKGEINDPLNMRGIKPENDNKMQLHGSKIREKWNAKYVQLDGLIKNKGLKKGTDEYNKFVRSYIEEASAELDHLYAPLFSEQWKKQTGKTAQATGIRKKKGGAKKVGTATKSKSASSGSKAKPGAKAATAKKPGKSSQASAAKKPVTAAAATNKSSSPAATKGGTKGKKKTPPASGADFSAKNKGQAKAKAKVPDKPAIAPTPGKITSRPQRLPGDATRVAKSVAAKQVTRSPIPKGSADGTRLTANKNSGFKLPPEAGRRAAMKLNFHPRGRFSGAARSGGSLLMMIATMVINHYAQKSFADEVREAAEKKINEAIDKNRAELEALLEKERPTIELAQAGGRRVRVHVGLSTSWQDASDAMTGINLYGEVMVGATVQKMDILYEGERAVPYKLEQGWLKRGVRTVLNNRGSEENLEFELDGTDEDVRAFNQRASEVEKAQGSPPVPFEQLIVQSLYGDLSPVSVREYAAYQRELASMSSDGGAGPRMAAYWSQMEALMDGPVDQLILDAKKKGIPLAPLRAFAVRERDVRGQSYDAGVGPHAVQYWTEIIEIIDRH